MLNMIFNLEKNKYITSAFIFVISVIVMPSVVFAAAKNFKELTGVVLTWIDVAIPITMSFAVMFFFKDIVISVFQKDSAEQSKKLKENAVWGIVILFLMVSIWGVVALLRNTFITTDSGFGGGGGNSGLPTDNVLDLNR